MHMSHTFSSEVVENLFACVAVKGPDAWLGLWGCTTSEIVFKGDLLLPVLSLLDLFSLPKSSGSVSGRLAQAYFSSHFFIILS